MDDFPFNGPVAATEPQDEDNLLSPAIDFEKLKRLFKEYVTGTEENNNLCIRDRDFYDGDQFTFEEVTTLLKRGQNPVASNYIFHGVNGILGIMDSAASNPVAYPRNQNA